MGPSQLGSLLGLSGLPIFSFSKFSFPTKSDSVFADAVVAIIDVAILLSLAQ